MSLIPPANRGASSFVKSETPADARVRRIKRPLINKVRLARDRPSSGPASKFGFPRLAKRVALVAAVC